MQHFQAQLKRNRSFNGYSGVIFLIPPSKHILSLDLPQGGSNMASPHSFMKNEK